MKFFYDLEFLEDGETVDLISIGFVTSEGHEYYAVNSDMPVGRIGEHDWLCKNVVPHLPLDQGYDDISEYAQKGRVFGQEDPLEFVLDREDRDVKPEWVIANEVRDFLKSKGSEVELWANFGAYDHVGTMQLWGPMMKKPDGVPMYTNDLQQLWRAKGRPQLPIQAPESEHHSLFDAMHDRDLFEFLAPLPYTNWPKGN